MRVLQLISVCGAGIKFGGWVLRVSFRDWGLRFRVHLLWSGIQSFGSGAFGIVGSVLIVLKVSGDGSIQVQVLHLGRKVSQFHM